jgi:hypothetical protein
MFGQSANTLMRRAAIGLLAAAGLSAGARAQLRENEVLVVYDSRITESLEVAEYYAGSAKVPGGTGTLAGSRPGVSVVNLATLPGSAGVVPFTPDIDYPTFKAKLRDPLRAYMDAQGLTRRVRSIVLTKGLPHRILNIGVTGNAAQHPTIGDNPGQVNNAFASGFGGNLTYASVDSELCLLWQDLDSGENGNVADSRADGMIVNPYWKASGPIAGYPTTAIKAQKTLVVPTFQGGAWQGIYWLNGTNPTVATTLTPGDMYLVCRLDAPTVNDVKGVIDRGRTFVYALLNSGIVFDKDSQQFDSTVNQPPDLTAGIDYDDARNALAPDGRFLATNRVYNALDGVSNFIVGPNINYAPATPIVVNTPLVLLASYGSNHTGIDGTAMETTYGTSFNLAPGAIFNTIESYNGRDFGGLGQLFFVPQQQASAFLASGGTFAVGNVWEPLSFAVSDNVFLVRNFLLGGLSWAEAAYTSLPVLSWQEIVVGDPLARMRRDREDVNGDGVRTIDDLYAQYATPVNINNIGAVDDADNRLIEGVFRVSELVNMKGAQR